MDILKFSRRDFQKISSLRSQDLSIQFENQVFKFSSEELMLFAPKVLEYFEKGNSSFIINIKVPSFKSFDVISAIEDLKSLFLEKNEIIISKNNSPLYKFLAETFGNEELLKKCEDALLYNISSYYLSLRSLSCVKQSLLENYETFEIELDNEIFKFNPVFISILSTKCEKLFSQGNLKFVVEHPSDVDLPNFKRLLSSVRSYFHGEQVDFSQFNDGLMDIFFDSFGIEKNEEIYLPQNLSEALEFLHNDISNNVMEYSAEFVASKFNEVLTDNELRNNTIDLSVERLDVIFSNSKLHLSSENDFFSFYINKLQIDENASKLSKHLKLSSVDKDKVIEYFEKRSFQNLTSEEFYSLLQWVKECIVIPQISPRCDNQIHNEYSETLDLIDQQIVCEKTTQKMTRVDFTKDCILKRTQYNEICENVINCGMNFIRKDKKSGQDWKQAVELFKIAADSGSIEGKWRYGRCLACGWGVPPDKERGIHILKEIMDKSEQGRFFYALCFPDDNPEKQKIIKDLMDKNDPNGFWSYGWMLYKDKLNPDSQATARKMIMKAAKLERKSYLNHLVTDISRGDFGFQPDPVRANQLKQMSEALQYLDEEFFYWYK